MRRGLWATLVLALVVGCVKQVRPTGPRLDKDQVAEVAWDRPLLDPTRARFTIKLQSDKLNVAGTTNGVMFIDAPERGRVDILGPLGGPLLVAATDGKALTVQLAQQNEHLTSAHAEEVLREATQGVAGIEDLIVVLAGGLPFQGAEVTTVSDDGELGTRLTFAGPEESEVTAWLDPVTGTPRRVVSHDVDGMLLLEATYTFESGSEGVIWMPSSVHLMVPGIELQVDLKIRKWEELETVPDVFTPDPPPRWSVSSLEDRLRTALEAELERPLP